MPKLLTQDPTYADWHPTRNPTHTPETITLGQHIRVWWKCATCSHEWQATVVSRCTGTRSGCPACAREKARHQQKARGAQRNPLANHPVSKELHPTRNGTLNPTDIAAASRANLWWKCGTCGHEWQTRAAHRTGPQQTGCPNCSTTSAGQQATTQAATANPLTDQPQAAEWHPSLNDTPTPHNIPAGSRDIAWWKCGTCGHEWQARITNRTRPNGTGCPECVHREHSTKLKGRRVLNRETLASHPELLKDWHPTRNSAYNPAEITAGSNRRLWWKCHNCGNEWQALVSNRAKKTNPGGCPVCAQRRKSTTATRRAALINPLANHPLANEWHPTLNQPHTPSTVSVGSSLRAWWQCQCGNIWQTPVSVRKSGSGCPECARQRISEAKTIRTKSTKTDGRT